MAIVGVANLAVKVTDLDEAIAYYERAGAEARDRQHWRNGERVDIAMGELALTLFTKAIYEGEADLPAEGFLHVALFTDDLDAEIIGHRVVWGPEVVSGAFGTRRIVFVEAPGGMRLEFMEQVEEPGPATMGASLAALGSATLGESGASILDRRLRPVWTGAAVAAPCYPVRCAPGDNLAVHAAVTRAPAGSVLVVEVPGDREHGFWGEVLTVAAQARGIAGLVIDACVRDTEALRAWAFPVFSTGIALPGATKSAPGATGTPVTVGGAAVAMGDWIVADRDGVVVVPVAEVTGILERGAERQAFEATLFERLEQGATTVELLGLDISLVDEDTGSET